MFEFLFKYPISTWRNADLVFSSGWSFFALSICLIVALFLIFFTLLRQNLSIPKRFGIGLLQFIAVAIGLLMLWQPGLRTESMQAGENAVAYLLDTSASMFTEDASLGSGSDTRISRASEVLERSIDEGATRFDASVYHLGTDLALQTEFDGSNAPAASGADKSSAIADGLLSVLEGVNDQALAAVVLLSDGADNTSDISSQWWQSIKAAGVPVHTVGFGNAEVLNDVELRNVNIDSQAGINSTVTARIQLVHNGYDAVRLRVNSGEQLLHAETLELDSSLDQSLHSIEFNSGEAGVKDIAFSVSANVSADLPANDAALSSGESQASNDTHSASTNVSVRANPSVAETNLVNNAQTRVLNVADQAKRVLYVEGEPRWEYKFLRRALHNFSGVEVVSLLRTSPNKFYRQGVKDGQELADGFPTTREALFSYDAVIIGSLEAAELSTEQQAHLRDFVSERGGSLLMLAGRQGLSDGGWGRSAVAAALPVKLNSNTNARDYERIRVVARPTTQGLRTPWLRLEDDDDANIQAWSELPELNDVQTIGIAKPGSTTLLAVSHTSQSQPLLVWHRYGQGQSYVLGTSGTWRWQMRLPSENQWHERFWQQFLSHLVAGSLPQLSLDNAQAVYRDAQAIPLAVTVRQTDYKPLEDGELAVRVTTPSGVETVALLNADIDQPGRFVGSIDAEEDGPYAVELSAPSSGEAQVGLVSKTIERWLIKESDTAEQFDTGLHREFLQRVSAATGGRYLDASDQDQLAEALSLQNAGITRENILPLWNMPLAFLLLLLAKAIEWILRLRWKRL